MKIYIWQVSLFLKIAIITVFVHIFSTNFEFLTGFVVISNLIANFTNVEDCVMILWATKMGPCLQCDCCCSVRLWLCNHKFNPDEKHIFYSTEKITTNCSTDYSLIGVQKYRLFTYFYLTLIITTFPTRFLRLLKLSPLALLQTTVPTHI